MIRSTFCALVLFGTMALAQVTPPPAPPPPAPAPVATQAAPGQVALIVSDAGALAPPEVHAVWSLAADELRAQGLPVSGDPRFETVQPIEAPVFDAMRADGISRLFVIAANGQLGRKIPFSIEERDPSGQVVASAQLSATGIEEADAVIPRLVRAVLHRETASQAATMDTVTEKEATPFKKIYGELMWTFGFVIPTYSGSGTATIFGLSAGYHYEAQFWRLGITGEAAGNHGENTELLGMDGSWIPLDGAVSPYLGGGFGFAATQSGNGVAAKVEGGVELFRLRSIRMLCGFELLIPFFNDNQKSVYPMAHIEIGF